MEVNDYFYCVPAYRESINKQTGYPPKHKKSSQRDAFLAISLAKRQVAYMMMPLLLITTALIITTRPAKSNCSSCHVAAKFQAPACLPSAHRDLKERGIQLRAVHWSDVLKASE